jgi:tetratricopeptide (TPR) repeat protein
LTEAETKQLGKRYTEKTEAYQLYLKGLYYSYQISADGFKKGIEYMNQAIALDPSYALAYAGLAASYYAASNTILPANEAMPKVKAAAMRALELNETLAEAHTILAVVKSQYEWNWLEAEREYKRALELNPGYAPAHQFYGGYLAGQGRWEEAITELTRARELDPLTPWVSTNLAYFYYLARRYDEAITQLRKIIETDPNFPVAHYTLGLAYEQKGMFAEAIAECNQARLLDPKLPFLLSYLGHAYAVSGKRDEARRMLEELKKSAKQTYVDLYYVAIIYVGLGETDQAFAWLEKAYQERSENLLALKVDPVFDSLRSDPRFADLLRRLNLSS